MTAENQSGSALRRTLQSHLGHHHLQVLPGVALLRRITQQKRRMVRDRELASIPAGIIAAHARRFEVVEAPAQFWLNLQNDYDLGIAEGSGIGKGIRPRKVAYDAEGADARSSITMRSLLAPSALTPSLPSAGPSTPRPSAADRATEMLDGR